MLFVTPNTFLSICYLPHRPQQTRQSTGIQSKEGNSVLWGGLHGIRETEEGPSSWITLLPFGDRFCLRLLDGELFSSRTTVRAQYLRGKVALNEEVEVWRGLLPAGVPAGRDHA